MLEDYPEYIIKQRTSHDGQRQYYVKWTGYDETDNTWESEQKLLAEWPFVLKEYNRRNVQTEPTNNNYNMDKETVFKYTNSVADWESSVDCIVYAEKSKLSGLVVYVKWKNGIKSVHHSSEVYCKCPQKMLDYFEQHRKFKAIHK